MADGGDVELFLAERQLHLLNPRLYVPNLSKTKLRHEIGSKSSGTCRPIDNYFSAFPKDHDLKTNFAL